MKQFHPEELALLTAIHAEPRDDTPRLVYADWLQEHDQPEYAEFIRWQIESGLIVGYSLSRKAAVLHTVVTSSAIEPATIDPETLPAAARLPAHVVERLRPFPRIAMHGNPHVTYVRGIPTVTVAGTTASARAFDRLVSSFHPSVRFNEFGILLDRLANPLEAVLANPMLQRAESLRVDCARDVISIDEFVTVASEAGLLARLLSIRLKTEDSEVATRLGILLEPIHPAQRGPFDAVYQWYTFWLRER